MSIASAEQRTVKEDVCGLFIRDVDSPSETVVLGVVDLPKNLALIVIRVYAEPCSLMNGQPRCAQIVPKEP